MKKTKTELCEVLNHQDKEIDLLTRRMAMVTQFALRLQDGTRDPNNAIALMIPHPDEEPRRFGIDDTRPVRMVWAIRSNDREEWLNHDSNYIIVNQTVTEYSIIGRKEAVLLKHEIPFYNTLDEMFDAYSAWESKYNENRN